MRLALLLLLVGAVGCGTRPSKGTVSQAQKAAEDPWPAAVAGLRKETTPGGLARVLGELSGAAAADPKYAAESLPAAAEPALKELARLTDDDLKAIRPAGYSALDSQYLAECQYLRDVARTLDADGLPPAEQAERAFAWVCRQVVPAPWVGPGRSPGEAVFFPPVPPTFVLRRGSGSGLERAYLFAAVCRQLGLDAVLVGPPDAADKTWTDDQPAGQPPRGPFWAVGARAGGDMKLYDPWRGVPLPVTLAQAVQTPDAVKESAPADRVKASVPFLAVSLSSLAPRLRRLEAELKADAPRLFLDLPAAVKSFADATKQTPKVWNPPADPFGPARGLASFLPPTDGGAADSQRFQSFRLSLLPVGAMRLPPAVDKLTADSAALQLPAEAIRGQAVGRFSRHFLNAISESRGPTKATDPSAIGKMLEEQGQPEKADRPQQPQQVVLPLENLPTVRERVQRRLLPNAVPGLVELRTELTAADARLRADPLTDARLADWAADAKQVYGAYLRAMDRNTPVDGAALAAYAQKHGRTLAALEGQAAVPVELAEATYLIALAKHEQAVGEQSKADRLKSEDAGRRAGDAWAEARGWWERYAPLADANDAAFPGRAAHARRLAADAGR